jgi:hypothetical protein
VVLKRTSFVAAPIVGSLIGGRGGGALGCDRVPVLLRPIVSRHFLGLSMA